MGNKTLQDVDEEFFDAHVNLNVKGPFFLTKIIAPHLKEGMYMHISANAFLFIVVSH